MSSVGLFYLYIYLKKQYLVEHTNNPIYAWKKNQFFAFIVDKLKIYFPYF